MGRQIWHQIRSAVRRADRTLPRTGRRPLYPDALVVRLHLWCVWRDRPRSFIKDRSHFGPLLRQRRLMSHSQFCRRLYGERMIAMIDHVNAHLAASAGTPTALAALDGKALAVSENGRDADAKKGRGNGGFARGYKLHARCTQNGVLPATSVTSLNAGEPAVAGESLLKGLPAGTLVLADGNYDSSRLHEQVDHAGGRLLTPLKGHARSRHRLAGMSAARRHSPAEWDADPSACRTLLRDRGCVERAFANLGNFGGGLTHLPPWVRGLARVRLWVVAKLGIYHARMRVRQLNA